MGEKKLVDMEKGNLNVGAAAATAAGDGTSLGASPSSQPPATASQPPHASNSPVSAAGQSSEAKNAQLDPKATPLSAPVELLDTTQSPQKSAEAMDKPIEGSGKEEGLSKDVPSAAVPVSGSKYTEDIPKLESQSATEHNKDATVVTEAP